MIIKVIYIYMDVKMPYLIIPQKNMSVQNANMPSIY